MKEIVILQRFFNSYHIEEYQIFHQWQGNHCVEPGGVYAFGQVY